MIFVINPYAFTAVSATGPVVVDQSSIYAILGQSRVAMTSDQSNIYAIVGQSRVAMASDQSNIYVILEIP